MKKISVVSLTALSLITLSACSGGMNHSNKTSNQTSTQETKKSDISEKKAKIIAFKDASVSEAEAKMIQVKKEKDDGISIYDIEFKHKDKEYSYTIDAKSGDILEKSSEPIHD